MFNKASEEDSQASSLDFTLATPVSGMAGSKLAEILAEISKEPDLNILTHYHPGRDITHHLEAGVKWIAQAGIVATPDQIAITNGSQHGISMSLSCVAQPGDTILTEYLTYPGFIQIAKQFGCILHPVAMDDEGLIPDSLEAACQQTKPRVLYTMPTQHNPLTVTMSEDRRKKIVEICRKYDLTIIEDDIWSPLPTASYTPLAKLAPERTVYVSGLSKAIAGGLRIGYVHAPGHLISAIRAAIRANSWMTAPLMSEIATRWINNGVAAELTLWQQQQSRRRDQIARGILKGFNFKSNPMICNIWLELPEPWRASEFLQSAKTRGVRFMTAETFTIGLSPPPQAARICLGGSKSENDVIRGLTILRDLLIAGPDSSVGVF